MQAYLDFAKAMALHAGDLMTQAPASYATTPSVPSSPTSSTHLATPSSANPTHSSRPATPHLATKFKADGTIVTAIDQAINAELIQRVQATFPTHSVDGEEAKFGHSESVWVCDPIDGTAMFARGIPTAVFSLALVVQGEPIVGVIYDPYRRLLYSAQAGAGAYCNDTPIQVNHQRLGALGSTLHFDLWAQAEYDLCDLIRVLNQRNYLISLGGIAQASCLVARGDLTAAIFPGTAAKYQDVAAAKLLVTEAGGLVTDFTGASQPYDRAINGALICNRTAHAELLALLKAHVHPVHHS